MKTISSILILVFSVIFIYSCGVSSELATQREMTHEYIKDYPNITKDVIFDKTMRWIANNFKSAKQVIDFQDKATGTIIAKGIIPNLDMGGVYSNNKLGFTLNVTIKEGKAKYEYDNLLPMNYEGVEYPQYTNRKSVQVKASSEFDKMINSLYSYTIKNDDF